MGAPTTEIDLQPGPQRAAAESTADIVLYGGAAGSGKTRWLVHTTAEYHDKSDYGAVIFRRTSPELRGKGSIWDETTSLYPLLGGEPTESRLTWTFPSGAEIQLSHLQLDKHVKSWQGKELTAVGFDEATHFTEAQFWFIWSRLRSASGLRTRFRMTCNPDPDSWLLPWVEWYLDESGFPDKDKSGKVRWLVRVAGKIHWFDSRDDALAAGHEDPISFAFFAAKLQDNKILMKADPSYRAKLLALPPIEQARLLGGNWRVRPQRGDYFQEAWFPKVPTSRIERAGRGFPPKLESLVVSRWRAWDLAATPVERDKVLGAPREVAAEESRPDADWTRGWLFHELRDGRVYLADLVSARDTPGAIEWLILRTAERDGKGTCQVFWRDPAQAGKHQETVLRRLLHGYRTATCPTFDPLDVARLASREAFGGRLLVPEDAPWLREVMLELTGFPSAPHDDAVSALGLGVAYWLDKREPVRAAPPRVGNETQRHVVNDVKTTSRFREF